MHTGLTCAKKTMYVIASMLAALYSSRLITGIGEIRLGRRRQALQATGHAALGGPLALVRDPRLQPALVGPVDPSPRAARGVAVALLAAIRRDVGPVSLPQVGPVAVLAHGTGTPGWRRRGPQAAGHAVLGGPLALVRDPRLQPALVAPVDPSPRVASGVRAALIAAVLRDVGPIRLPQVGPVAVLADPGRSAARSRLKSGWRRRGPQAAGHAVLGGPLALVRDPRLQPALVAPVDPSPRVASG